MSEPVRRKHYLAKAFCPAQFLRNKQAALRDSHRSRPSRSARSRPAPPASAAAALARAMMPREAPHDRRPHRAPGVLVLRFDDRRFFNTFSARDRGPALSLPARV